MTPDDRQIDAERAHEEAWYGRAIAERFFEHEGFRRLVAWNVEALRREVPLRADMRVLSIGSGLGDYELALAHEVGHITAVELSPTAAAHTRARLWERGLTNVDVVCGAIDTQSFGPGSFDLVYAMGVFHHFTPDQRARLFGRVVPWLAEGAWFYLRDPNARGLLRRALEGWFRHRSDVHAPQETSLDPYDIAREAAAAGLRDTQIDYVDVIGGPLPWLIRSDSRLLWTLVFGLDRLWLSVPGVRRGASQFALVARR
jgi:SAM-dependent methyltransferase